MKADLQNREDIDRLMQVFYERAIDDEVIGYIFTDVAHLDLDHHLPIIGDFWEGMLFGTPAYTKHGRNPMIVHKELDAKSPLTREHFERWLEIFTTTVNDLFAGERAEVLKMRAQAIAARMLQSLGIVTGIDMPVGVRASSRSSPE
jgi:hemoglobin